jgi:hypothetical protein
MWALLHPYPALHELRPNEDCSHHCSLPQAWEWGWEAHQEFFVSSLEVEKEVGVLKALPIAATFDSH